MICSKVFTIEKEDQCHEETARQVLCDECLLTHNGYKRLKDTFLSCPNCKLEIQHGGGCNQMSCCKYGFHNCKEECNHGSTEVVKFCGHKWEIKEEPGIVHY
jgi:hypothetical protein